VKITPAPKYNLLDVSNIVLDKIKKGISLKIVDEKNRYSHWDKIQYLPLPKGFKTIEEYWFFIKYSRVSQYKNLPFIENFVYILTDEIQENLHKIDSQMHGSIESQNIHQNNEKFIVRSLIDEAISSSQLEGAATTRKIAKEMLISKRAPKDHSEQMIYNNYLAIKFIEKHKNDELTPNIILELHKIVTSGAIENLDDSGRLRINDEIAVYDDMSNTLLHTPPSHSSLASRIKLLCDFANGKSPNYFIHPVIRAILVHFILAYDHPFSDGNGRTARALFYWMMLKNNYWLFQYITISKYIYKSSAQYGESFLMTETDDFDTTYFINSQLKFINNSIDGLFKYIDKKQNQQQKALKLLSNYLQNGKINPRQAMLIQDAVKNPGKSYTIATYKIMQNVGYDIARQDLLKLVKLTLLIKSKIGREFVFISPNDLEQRINNK
jgi:Fic family protein